MQKEGKRIHSSFKTGKKHEFPSELSYCNLIQEFFASHSNEAAAYIPVDARNKQNCRRRYPIYTLVEEKKCITITNAALRD